MQSVSKNLLIATFQLLSATSMNLGWSQNGVLWNGLNLHPWKSECLYCKGFIMTPKTAFRYPRNKNILCPNFHGNCYLGEEIIWVYVEF